MECLLSLLVWLFYTCVICLIVYYHVPLLYWGPWQRYTNPKFCILGAEEAATTFRGLDLGGPMRCYGYTPLSARHGGQSSMMPRSGRSTSHLEVIVVSSVYCQSSTDAGTWSRFAT